MREYMEHLEPKVLTDGERVLQIGMSIYRYPKGKKLHGARRNYGWDIPYTEEVLRYTVVDWDEEREAWLVEEDLDELVEKANEWELMINRAGNEEVTALYDIRESDEASVIWCWV